MDHQATPWRESAWLTDSMLVGVLQGIAGQRQRLPRPSRLLSRPDRQAA